MNTLLITGASTGIGRATAIYFADKGWNVIATMRNAVQDVAFVQKTNITCLQLDVTNPASIESAVQQAIGKFGKIDVLFNNAGYALAGAFEAVTESQIRKQFETNVFGVMNVTRAILPHFRTNHAGIVLNTTSSGGIITFPLYSVYNSSKWAIEGFMESLQFELRQFGIVIKNIEPASVKSEFVENIEFISNPVYDNYSRSAQKGTLDGYKNAPTADVVAKIVYKAATDGEKKLRYAGTPQARLVFFMRWLLPLKWFNSIIAKQIEK
ncbi:SDR family oxidoreductase [Dyadobacter sp. CY326]|uniref:SDR family oxidoreductase n=1 Tax=Dyadobacter sp. CY326 TaxID=2907300 RepID=UPI001F359073|nr:SDR family oxidoreductase [Dyadobacter sp. CY326]MCE7065777.1 SDR family oxidoreductase [Dyadobacter sp. CY326]